MPAALGLSYSNFGGGRWIRTTEAFASDLQSDPFGRSGIPPKFFIKLAIPSLSVPLFIHQHETGRRFHIPSFVCVILISWLTPGIKWLHAFTLCITVIKIANKINNLALEMELARGVEPPTGWLQVSCSTNWATPASLMRSAILEKLGIIINLKCGFFLLFLENRAYLSILSAILPTKPI